MTGTSEPRIDHACLVILIVLQGLMLAALYALSEPHPPARISPFALGPFLSASIALAGAALVLGGTASRPGLAVTAGAALAALVSFGPQKWFHPALGDIWPAVVLAEIACAVLIWRGLRRLRAGAPLEAV